MEVVTPEMILCPRREFNNGVGTHTRVLVKEQFRDHGHKATHLFFKCIWYTGVQKKYYLAI